jgi:hypothetical protein
LDVRTSLAFNDVGIPKVQLFTVPVILISHVPLAFPPVVDGAEIALLNAA